jgi:hypothetical protein
MIGTNNAGGSGKRFMQQVHYFTIDREEEMMQMRIKDKV